VLAVLAYYGINRFAVCLAVSLDRGMSMREAWRLNFGAAGEALSAGSVFSLGILLAVHEATFGALGSLLIVLPLVIAFESYGRAVGGPRIGTVPARASDRRAA
jgi:hypothetical protein